MNVVDTWEATNATPLLPHPTSNHSLLAGFVDSSHLSPSASATREGLLCTRSQHKEDKETELFIALKVIIGMINARFDIDDKDKIDIKKMTNKKMNG